MGRRTNECRTEEASFPVFEAILVAIIIFAAMIFLTSLQRPSGEGEALGVDMGRIASDSLEVLSVRNFTVGPDKLFFEQWINRSMQDDPDVEEEVHAFITEFLPTGTRYVLRIDNGIETIALLPPGPEPTPRAGRGASTFLVPNWTAFSHKSIDETVRPGGAWTSDPCNGGGDDFVSLRSPTNVTTAPDGGTWVAWWCAKAPEPERVPLALPTGVWQYETGSCTPCHMMVGVHGDGPRHPVVAVQMVVWNAA